MYKVTFKYEGITGTRYMMNPTIGAIKGAIFGFEEEIPCPQLPPDDNDWQIVSVEEVPDVQPAPEIRRRQQIDAALANLGAPRHLLEAMRNGIRQRHTMDTHIILQALNDIIAQAKKDNLGQDAKIP